VTPRKAKKRSVDAVVVNRDAGEYLLYCVKSLRDAGVSHVVVVDNASSDGSLERLSRVDSDVVLAPTGRNLGYGVAANIGVRRCDSDFVLICNSDLIVGKSAIAELSATLDAHDDLGLVGPRIEEPSGAVYPSAREFPQLGDAIGHAFVGMFQPDNPWTKRYRLDDGKIGDDIGDDIVDWVSGACVLVRRLAYMSVGGFDEAYFMYVEDLDLCWRLRRAAWGVGYVSSANVVHEQGVSTQRHPYRMLVAHHASTWRFVRRSASGRTRALLPVLGAGISARLGLALSRQLVEDHGRPRISRPTRVR
jgi:N-acetylglucosaminyl-diphospho-decaprenol L-rhamnosyltransferase